VQFVVRYVADHVAPLAIAKPPMAFVDENHRPPTERVSGKRSRRRSRGSPERRVRPTWLRRRPPRRTPRVGAWPRLRRHTVPATTPRSSGGASRMRHHTTGSGTRTTACAKVSGPVVD
jgi:hypothetical protein